MKTKLIGFSLFLGLFLMPGIVQKASATNAARTAKPGFALNYTTTVSTISTSPCVLYAVIPSTGAVNEFLVAFDTNTQSFVQLNKTSTSSEMKFRLLFSSQTVPSVPYVFDPPLQFMNGLYVVDSAATGSSLWIWEPGRGVGAE